MSVLADIIKTEADEVSAFVLLLGEEQDALKSGNPEALPDIVARKSAVAGRISALTGRRNIALARDGLPADRPGVTGWLERNPGDNAVRKSWERLQQLAEEARELNRVNGELIQIRLQANSQALEALLSAANRQDLYGADGQAEQAATRRIIDSA